MWYNMMCYYSSGQGHVWFFSATICGAKLNKMVRYVVHAAPIWNENKIDAINQLCRVMNAMMWLWLEFILHQIAVSNRIGKVHMLQSDDDSQLVAPDGTAEIQKQSLIPESSRKWFLSILLKTIRPNRYIY